MNRIENLTRPLVVIGSEGSDGGAATVRLVSLAIARFEPDGDAGVLGRDAETAISADSTKVRGIRDEERRRQAVVPRGRGRDSKRCSKARTSAVTPSWATCRSSSGR